MPAVDFKPALGNPTSLDHANVEIQGMRVSRTIKLGLFTINRNAVKAGDYLLSKESYPIARVRFPANRRVFKLQPGDPFVFKYPKYGITQMVCRVVSIEEEDVESEKITVTAVEEYTKATKPVSSYTEPPNYRKSKDTGKLQILTPIGIIEAPYSLARETLKLIFLVPKRTGKETGYTIYMSQDGSEYYRLRTGNVFCPWGTLVADYSITSTIDDEHGFTVTFDNNQYTDAMQSISRTELYGTRNLALLGDEIITFQTVTPITTNQFKFTGVYRGRWGTVNKAHSIGENFFFVGTSYVPVEHYSFLVGSTRYFKVVPFSSTSAGSLSAAVEYTHTFTGEAFTPYEPINFKANDDNFRPTYDATTPEDIVLTWDGRVRGDGTGLGDPSAVTDSTQTWEGKFRVEVWVDGSLIRTVEEIDAQTYTYTAATVLSDNGHYPSYIDLKLTNYLTGDGNIEYESDEVELTVRKNVITTTTAPPPVTTTTSTTTTTT